MSKANSFGSRFQVQSFGESHGPAMGAVIEGCPAGLPFDFEFLCSELARRRPGRHGEGKAVQSLRQEEDLPEVLSGVYQGLTLGTPIAVLVRNRDARPQDYEAIIANPRKGHADDVWKNKFGHNDPRGGGRSSGRETLARVIGGAVAKMLLKKLSPETRLIAFASQIGPYNLEPSELEEVTKSVIDIDTFSARFPSSRHLEILKLLSEAQAAGESWGGTVSLSVLRPPFNLGQPVFHKLKADLAAALMSIGAVNSVELGIAPFDYELPGTKFHSQEGFTYGGIRGGISTGDPIDLHLKIKPTSSILDVAKSGRHDPCIVPRIIPVVEAMAAMVLVDHLLWSRTDRL